MSETANNNPGPDPEDLPNDFFDDFSKAEFIEGLSVIDSWDDDDSFKPKTSRIDKAAVDSVQDLRELIQNSDTSDKESSRSSKNEQQGKPELKRKRIEDKSLERRSKSHELDSYIRPGSRRDPNKTNEAIRKDKQEKVKEHLAKSLDNVKPPGTELDDFCEDTTLMQKNISPKRNQDQKTHESGKRLEESRYNEEPRRNEGRRIEEPRRHDEYVRLKNRTAFEDRRNRGSPHRLSPRRSPRRRYSPVRRFSPRRHSPYRRSPLHWRGASRSPERRRSRSHDRRRSPDRRMSPLRHRSTDKKQSPEIRHKKDYRVTSNSDNFLYPKNPSIPQGLYKPTNVPSYPTPVSNSTPSWEPNPVKITAYNYAAPAPQSVPVYPTSYPGPYEFAAQPGPPGIVPATAPYAAPPQAVPAPSTLMSGPSILGPVPTMVPAPVLTSSVPNYSQQIDTTITNPQPSYNALAQLVAEGKISKEDYQKLAPNKGATSNTGIIDPNDKVQLLSRCQDAVGKLTKLRLPNRLIVLQNMPTQEPKSIASKYCSPLKRQPMVQFQFTQPTQTTLAQQNKLLIDNIAVALGFDKLLNKQDKKEQTTTKDAAVQTSRPYCDVCEIRDSTKYSDAGTSTKHEYFTSSVYTQVVDQDLASSKSLFTPGGGMGDGAPISIAHLTPAQLVSQLAARAKTLKQNEPAPESYPQYGRRDTQSNYEYDRGGNDYNNRGYRY